MCGIAGVVQCDGRRASAALLRRMIAQLRHRGPDAAGAYCDCAAGLAHARLSILDLAGGRQPMLSEDRSLALTFNGEIFNYLELRDELEARGRRFVTRSDTEVILQAYAEYGPRCVERFNGQWAFALWDRRRRRLFASRDRLGVRPFYHVRTRGALLFASEAKALFVDPEVPRAIDPVGLDQFFTFWAPLAPRTVFAGVSELPPAHNLFFERGRLSIERYWRLEYAPEPIASDACAERLLELLVDAARLRLRSDVPVGAYLSGGLDSTLVTALARRIHGGRLATFSIGFDDAEFDERKFQREAAEALSTDHRTFAVAREEIGAALPATVWHLERPTLRTAPAPLLLLSRKVREAGYKVVLTGEGADELLGGYDLFKEAKVRRHWARQPSSARRAALLEGLYPYLPSLRGQPPAYRQAFFAARPEDLSDRLFSHLPRWRMTAGLKRFLAPEFRCPADAALAALTAQLPDGFDRWHPLCRAQALETEVLLPGYILASQGDRAAMAHSVEGRFPFLDYRVAEFAARIPPRLKMRGLEEKWILKRAARGLVPPAIVRRAKQPYRAPEATSLFGDAQRPLRFEYVDELLGPQRVARAGVFLPEAVAGLVAKARQGRIVGLRDHMALLGILTTQSLVDQFVENLATAPAPPLACQTTCGALQPANE